MMETQDGNARSPPKSPASPPGVFWCTPPGEFVFGDPLELDEDPLDGLSLPEVLLSQGLLSQNPVVETALPEKNAELTAENERLLRRLEAAELNMKRGHRINREPTDQELARLECAYCKCVVL